MPDIRLVIGDRPFDVACQAGEERYLRAAEAILDGEARSLIEQAGRVSEARMLVMAGLMVADRVAGLEDQIRTITRDLATARNEAATARAELAAAHASPVQVEVAVVPAELAERLADFAGRSEELAARLADLAP